MDFYVIPPKKKIPRNPLNNKINKNIKTIVHVSVSLKFDKKWHVKLNYEWILRNSIQKVDWGSALNHMENKKSINYIALTGLL